MNGHTNASTSQSCEQFQAFSELGLFELPGGQAVTNHDLLELQSSPIAPILAFLSRHLVPEHRAQLVREQVQRLLESNLPLETKQRLFPVDTMLGQHVRKSATLNKLDDLINKANRELQESQAELQNSRPEINSLRDDFSDSKERLAALRKMSASIRAVTELLNRAKDQKEPLSQLRSPDNLPIDSREELQMILSKLHNEHDTQGNKWTKDSRPLTSLSQSLGEVERLMGQITSISSSEGQSSTDTSQIDGPQDAFTGLQNHIVVTRKSLSSLSYGDAFERLEQSTRLDEEQKKQVLALVRRRAQARVALNQTVTPQETPTQEEIKEQLDRVKNLRSKVETELRTLQILLVDSQDLAYQLRKNIPIEGKATKEALDTALEQVRNFYTDQLNGILESASSQAQQSDPS